MELCSPLTLLYTIYTNPERTGGLPKIHIWLTTLYCMHYFHRALLSPILLVKSNQRSILRPESNFHDIGTRRWDP